MPTLNERLKQLRKDLNLSQKDFAEKIGISQRAASWSEQPGNNVSDSTVKAVCLVYGVSEDWLRNGIEPMYKSSPKISLDELCRSLGATDLEIRILKAYFELPLAIRTQVINHYKQILTDPAEQESAIDIDAEVAAYRAELEEQQKKGDGSSASDGSGAKMA